MDEYEMYVRLLVFSHKLWFRCNAISVAKHRFFKAKKVRNKMELKISLFLFKHHKQLYKLEKPKQMN